MKKIVLSASLTFTFFFTFPAHSQEKIYSQDTLATGPKWHQTKVFRTLAVPSIMTGFGFISTNNKGYLYTNYEAYQDIRQHFPDFQSRLDNITAVLPGIAVYGLNLTGIKGKHDFADRTIIYGLSSLIAISTVLGLKEAFPHIRPDSTNNNSFPSGHTAGAFVSAEFMHQEFKDESIWYSIAGYSVASLTGAMRMLNNRHWLSDVLVGGAIGMFTTKVVYLAYPWIDEKTNRNKHYNMGFMPFFTGHSAGLVVVWVIR
jgi:hypothetical protein